MPIVIRELHIKVSVNAPEGGTASPAGAAGTTAGNPADPEERERLVAQCVEQVLEILKNQQEA